MTNTPETDSFASRDWRRHARKLERERDEAREKIKRQTDRIRYLEGATNHACGTPLSVALKERDEAREQRDRLADSLKTIEWSNNSEWQSNCAKCALATLDHQL